MRQLWTFPGLKTRYPANDALECHACLNIAWSIMDNLYLPWSVLLAQQASPHSNSVWTIIQLFTHGTRIGCIVNSTDGSNARRVLQRLQSYKQL